MRHIRKGPEPIELAAFKAAATENWKPRYRDLEKKPVRKALVDEQGHLCGYCGCRVGDHDGDCHIEHLAPQSEEQDRALDYGNMLASCMGSDKQPPIPEHCGHARGTKPVPVSPFFPDCGSYFLFGSDGRIEACTEPAKQDAARRTIERLRLDIPRLKAAREAAIDGALRGLDLDTLTADDLRAEAARYDLPDLNGHLYPFCFAIRQVLFNYS